MVKPQPPPKPAPTLDETIKTLTEYGSTPESEDLLAAAQWVTKIHTAESVEFPDESFGFCRECENPWPCAAWDEIRDLTLSWLIRASNQAISTSRDSIRRLR